MALSEAVQGVMLASLARRLRPSWASRPCTLQARILLALAQRGAGVEAAIPMPNLSELARQLGVTQRVANAAFNRLVEGGYLTVDARAETRVVRQLAWVERVVTRPAETIRLSAALDAIGRDAGGGANGG